ncbi:hypothetical protein BDZ45DRAFT_745674 [Acephala macrosclerotiorum]|nr:hypothetical protein BDZ45DRAFT_745674 [Acephala macrosclerotiorum]
MKYWQAFVVPVVLASVLRFSAPPPTSRELQAIEEPPLLFSQGLKVDQHYFDTLLDLKVEVEVNNKSSSNLFRRYVPETTAPPSTIWQGVNGNQWDTWSQDVVVKAWAEMMEMAKYAVEKIEEVMPDSAAYQLFQQQTTLVNGVCQSMKKDTTRSTPEYLLCYRTFIAAHNLAYGQLFGADPENIQLIRDNFQRIIDQTENLAAEAVGVPAANGFIRANTPVYLTLGNALHNLAGKNICEATTQGNDFISISVSRADYALKAFAVVASGTQEFSSNSFVPGNAYIIHFCPPFFQLPRMERQRWDLSNGGLPKETWCNLNLLDSTARALLHEVTHLPWVLNTNAKEKEIERYGFYSATAYGSNYGGVNQAPFTKTVSSRNADSYAWMAVYNFWNGVDKCQGVRYTGVNQAPSRCNTDVWPDTPDANGKLWPKLIKTQWNNYAKGENSPSLVQLQEGRS